MPDIEGDNGAARAYYIRLLPLYTMETQRVQGFTGAARSRDCTLVPRNLEIAQTQGVISRLACNFGILRLRKFLDCA